MSDIRCQQASQCLSKNPQSKRIAALDIGTNTVLAILAEIQWRYSDCPAKCDQPTLLIIEQLLESPRLGENLSEHGFLQEKAIERTIQAISRILVKFNQKKYDEILLVGTSALRRAKNASTFQSRLSTELNLNLQILNGSEEAKYSSLAAIFSLQNKIQKISKKNPVNRLVLDFEWQPSNLTICEIGGGSTQLIYSNPNQSNLKNSLNRFEMESIELGCVSITEVFFKEDPPSKNQIHLAKRFIKDKLKEFTIISKIRKDTLLIGLGGTITALVAAELSLKKYAPDKIHGYELNSQQVQKWFNCSLNISLLERIKFFLAEPKRAEVIIAGILILQEILAALRIEKMLVSVWGLRLGLVIDKVFSNYQKLLT